MTRLARAALVALLSTVFFARVFRFDDPTWSTASLGGWIDPYFINVVLEHWRTSLMELRNPASPPMYYPVPHTLGYSCGLILYAPWYVLLRIWSHPFVAHTLTIFAVVQLGTWSLYAFLRRGFGLGFGAALVLTCSAVTSLNLVNAPVGGWSQRASVFLVPQFLWLAAVGVTASTPLRRMAACVAAGAMYGLMFVQDFPSAMFTTLAGVLVLGGVGRTWQGAAWCLGVAARFVGRRLTPPPGRIATVVATALAAWAVLSRMRWFRHLSIDGHTLFTDASALVVLAALAVAGWPALRRSPPGRRAVEWLTRVGAQNRWTAVADRPTAISMAAGAIAGIVTFVWIYLPAYQEHPAFPDFQLIEALKAVDPAAWHTPLDALRALMPYPSARPFLLVAAATLLAWVPGLRVPRGVRGTLAWLSITAVVVMLLAVQFPQFSLWRAVLAPLPGLGAVRDPLRLIPFYELALTVGLALMLTRAAAQVWFVRLLLLASVAITAVTWSVDRFDYERVREDYARWVEPPIQIDPECRSFYMKRATAAYEARSGHIWSLYGNDATMIALAHGIPTLNGYSGWEPTGWELANPPAPDYEQKVAEWIAAHRLTGVCALDIAARTMTPWRR